MTGAYNFYIDPTHGKPLPPAAVGPLLEDRGYRTVNTYRLYPDEPCKIGGKALKVLPYGPQDFAAIGYK